MVLAHDDGPPSADVGPFVPSFMGFFMNSNHPRPSPLYANAIGISQQSVEEAEEAIGYDNHGIFTMQRSLKI